MGERNGFEAIKYALRQSKDGTVVSFVIHPNDLDPELQCLPIGTRVMIGWAAISDDEKPVARPDNAEHSDQGPWSEPPQVPKRERTLSEEAFFCCKDARFQDWLEVKGLDDAKQRIYTLCRIDSLSHLSTNRAAAHIWQNIHADFRNHLAEIEHGGSINR